VDFAGIPASHVSVKYQAEKHQTHISDTLLDHLAIFQTLNFHNYVNDIQ